MSYEDNPFTEPAFLEGLEAAGFVQRLDVSEARITARFQHALAKMNFAKHSEEFLGRAGVQKVHSSTIQFFSEEPTCDPFVHVLVGSLPPSAQALITPAGLGTSAWTPINDPNEADGTRHFSLALSGFWPVTVIFDVNTNPNRSSEDRYASADSFSGSASGSGSQSSQSNGGRPHHRVRSQSSGSSRSASQSGSGRRRRQRRNRSRSPVGSATSSQRRRTRHSSARSLNGGTARSAGGRRSRRGSVRSSRSGSRSSSQGARRQRRNRRRASRSSSRSSSIDRAARAIAAISLVGAPRRQRSRRNGSVRAGGSQY